MNIIKIEYKEGMKSKIVLFAFCLALLSGCGKRASTWEELPNVQ